MNDTIIGVGPACASDTEKFLDGHLLAKMAQGGAAQLRSNADEVNKLNVFPVPDGDTGDNMRMTIESGVAALADLDTDDLSQVVSQLSRGMLLGARGNSGVILSQLFAGMAKGFSSCQRADVATLSVALELGVKQAYGSVMTPTEGTILTVAREAVEYAQSRITPKSTIRTLFSDLMQEMYASLQRTPEILAVLKQAGVIDSGGAGLFYIMDGFNRVLNGEEITAAGEPLVSVGAAKSGPDLDAFGPDSELTYGYCTELLLRLQSSKVDLECFDETVIRDFLADVGDSVVTFRTDSIVKIHVHTKTPDAVLGFCRQFGEFLTVKIENMSLQHNESSADTAPAAAAPVEKKKYGIVAVCSGEGIEQTFRDIGTDAVVSGGQTQNPSTSDFLNAFACVPAEHLFVFPNNGNIIMAARQAAEIYTDATVHVIESKDLGAGYVAISSIDVFAPDAQTVIDQANEAMSHTATGTVSPAIRTADLDGVHIEEGDYIGFVGKHMLVSEKDQLSAARALLDRMITPDTAIVTVFIGKSADENDAAALEGYLSQAHPDVEAYFVPGGQDVYPFIVIAE